MIKFNVIYFRFFRLFSQKKIFKFLKRNNISNLDILLDVGAHKGESIISFGKNLNIKKYILLKLAKYLLRYYLKIKGY